MVKTVRKNRMDFPSSLKLQSKVVARESLYTRVHPDGNMAALHWSNTKVVHFLSTIADPMAKSGIEAKQNSGEE